MDNSARNREIIQRRKSGQYPFQICKEMGLTKGTVVGVLWRSKTVQNDRLEAFRASWPTSNHKKGRPKGSRTYSVGEGLKAHIRNIYRRHSRDFSAAEIARNYGLHATTVYRIIHGGK